MPAIRHGGPGSFLPNPAADLYMEPDKAGSSE